ncbi:MAG: polysaccharide deacetylase family protein [Bacteroidota bacterium]
MNHPIFTISLDFEMMWGVFDKRSINTYGSNILGSVSVIPKMLALFEKYNVHATWAVVGCLHFNNLSLLSAHLSKNEINYCNSKLSAYKHGLTIDEGDYLNYYSAPELIKKIAQTPGQEIGSHTFSHYYCLEPGQTIASFSDDLRQSIDISAVHGYSTKSIIFPRNQYSTEYLKACKNMGVVTYRGNENNRLQTPRNQDKLSLSIRLLRLIDSYLNLTGSNDHKIQSPADDMPINVPSSSFFRPYNAKLKLLEWLKIRRIKNSMTKAAKNNSLYHLWWHPHNFGINQQQNLKQLEEILKHYSYLNKVYLMKSLNMNEIGNNYNSK